MWNGFCMVSGLVLESHFENSDASFGASLLCMTNVVRSGSRPPAYIFLDDLANSKASDPRDHVYAFLGVLPPIHHL
jgi:hypothetical protein